MSINYDLLSKKVIIHNILCMVRLIYNTSPYRFAMSIAVHEYYREKCEEFIPDIKNTVTDVRYWITCNHFAFVLMRKIDIQ